MQLACTCPFQKSVSLGVAALPYVSIPVPVNGLFKRI